MTTIAMAVTENGGFAAASDLASSYDYTIPRANPKYYRMPGVGVVGFGGDLVLVQAVLSRTEWETPSDIPGVVREEADRIGIKAGIGEPAGQSQTPTYGIEALMVWEGSIYLVGPDLSIVQCGRPFWAIGTGAEFAIGAMLMKVGRARDSMDKLALVEDGVRAACEFDPYSAGLASHSVASDGSGLGEIPGVGG